MSKTKYRVQGEGIRTIGILPSLMLLMYVVPSDKALRNIAAYSKIAYRKRGLATLKKLME